MHPILHPYLEMLLHHIWVEMPILDWRPISMLSVLELLLLLDNPILLALPRCMHLSLLLLL
jgi:hypothetical protein